MRKAMALAVGIALIVAGTAGAEDRMVEGRKISVTGNDTGSATLMVDGAVLHENGAIYLDDELLAVDGVTLVTGAAGAGGNACNAAPFVLALPVGGAPEFWGPVDSCAYLTPKQKGQKLIFTSEPMAGAAGETWVWSRDGGFVPGPAVGFSPNAGWEALDSLDGVHPSDALAIAPVMAALQAGLGPEFPAFVERISGIGSGSLTTDGYLGSACIKFSCEADWAILYLHRATRTAFVVWQVYGEMEPRIWPPVTTTWPPEAMFMLRGVAKE